MSFGRCLSTWMLIAIVPVVYAGQAQRLVRSVSGPSGTTVGQAFVIDSPRTRFVYPQDRSLTVYFEWEWPAGDHELVATWTAPSGRVVSVSPPVRIKSDSTDLKSYWMFEIGPSLENGAWTVSVRIDGQPAGSHSFEIAGADANGGRLTLDQVFRRYAPSIAKIRRLDRDGRPIDSSHGFVIGPNAVATSFQSIDAADAIEVEFGDGRKVPVTSAWAVSRSGDWAIVNVDTAGIAAIPRGEAPPIGARVASFDTDGGAMVIVAVDVGGVGPSPSGATRIRFGPPVTLGALGGPLIDDHGTVIGLIGGSLTPGLRAPAGPTTCSVPSSWVNLSRSTGSVVSDLGALGSSPTSFTDLRQNQVLTSPLEPMPEFDCGGTAAEVPKDSANRVIHEITEFSRRDNKPILAYAYWSKKAKLSKGEVSVALFDADNRQKDVSPPKKVSLNASPQRFFASWASKDLMPGFYRVDFLWDGTPVWRTYFHVTD